MTLKESILIYINKHPGESAYQVAKALGDDPSNVSTRLKEMLIDSKVTRVKGKGPRGGFGYYIINHNA